MTFCPPSDFTYNGKYIDPTHKTLERTLIILYNNTKCAKFRSKPFFGVIFGVSPFSSDETTGKLQLTAVLSLKKRAYPEYSHVLFCRIK